MTAMAQLEKLVLIDGSGFIFRAFYALPPMSRSDGTPTNAVFGFTRMLLATLEQVQSEADTAAAVAVIFDSSRHSFRTDIYPLYKANRREPPKELVPQFALIKKLPEAFNLPSLQMDGFEADDLIATLATEAALKKIPVIVISSDKDLMQIVSPRVIMRDPMKNKDINEEAVVEYFGVPPQKVAEVQALAGDSGDNVPGVPGVGIKTAAMLINGFGSLDAVLTRAAEIPQRKRRETILASIETVKRGLKLVTLDKRVPLVDGLWNDLAFKPLDPERLIGYLRELEFPKIIEEVQSRFGNRDEVKIERAVRAVGKGEAEKLLRHLQKQSAVGLHLEQGMEQGMEQGEVQLAWVGGSLRLDASEDKALLAAVLRAETTKIVHDAKRLFRLLGDEFAPYQDIMLMAHMAGAADSFAALKAQFAPKMDDAAACLKIYEGLLPLLIKNRTFGSYQTLELPLAAVLARMEAAGFRVKAETLRVLDEKFAAAAAELQVKIFRACGREFNLGSPKQLAQVLFAEMGLPHAKKGRSGTYSTSASVLGGLAATGHEVAADILRWRYFSKLKSTYCEGLLRALDAKSGRVHTTFLQNATNTGRLSSQNPNLQNIPIRDEEGKALRRAFIADDGNVLLAADYSQIELRILAWLAGVTSLQRAFAEGADIHAETATRLFSLGGASEVRAEHRRRAKAINFGIIYGMGAQALAAALKISIADARNWIKEFFRHYPQIADYMDKARALCRAVGYIRTPLGRICRLEQVRSHRPELVAFAERAAINAPIQGAAAEIIKRAMIRFDEQLRRRKLKARLLLQIHDELLVEAAKSQAGEVVELLCETMAKAPLPTLAVSPPLRVDYGVGDNWDEISKSTYEG